MNEVRETGPVDPEEERHGHDTLRVWRGTVVGVTGEDVFVELGPRMQGVISRRSFEEEPAEGDSFDFTLRGREEGLWVLQLKEEEPLTTWQDLEVGMIVHARATSVDPGGLQLKVGALHAFMPRSQTGLSRERKPAELLGKTFACEVIEVDYDRQRAVLSRKLVLQRERESGLQRLVGALRPGQVVQGRVTRIEPYGAFLALGHGLQGLVHVSDLSVERVEHPDEVVKRGDHLEVKVLHIKRGGRRIGLGLKQMERSPWEDIEDYLQPGEIVEGTVTRLAPFGIFVEVFKGVEGLVHVSEAGSPPNGRLEEIARRGDPVSVRVLTVEPRAERLSLSLLHAGGARIAPEEAANASFLGEVLSEEQKRELGTNLGSLIRRALDE